MKRNLSPLKIIYRTLTAILSAYWIFFAVGFSFNCVSRVYLYPLKHKDYVFDSANYYGLDPLLIFSVIKVESDFDVNAKSNAGAIGLMQITSDTGKYVADMQGIVNYDLTNAKTNIEFGCFYLKYLILKFEYLDTALCAYNAGEGNVSAWLNNSKYSLDKKTLILIPFKETDEYLKKIHKTFENYRKLYRNILDKSKNFE